MYFLPHHGPPRHLSMSLSVNILRTCPRTSKTSVYILVCQCISYLTMDLQDICLCPCLSIYYVHVRGPPRPLSISLSVNILRTCPWTSKTSVYILVCQYITYMSADLQDLLDQPLTPPPHTIGSRDTVVCSILRPWLLLFV